MQNKAAPMPVCHLCLFIITKIGGLPEDLESLDIELAPSQSQPMPGQVRQPYGASWEFVSAKNPSPPGAEVEMEDPERPVSKCWLNHRASESCWLPW